MQRWQLPESIAAVFATFQNHKYPTPQPHPEKSVHPFIWQILVHPRDLAHLLWLFIAGPFAFVYGIFLGIWQTIFQAIAKPFQSPGPH